MSQSEIALLTGGLYLAASLLLGLLAGRRATASTTGWVAGDRGLGLLVMYFITGATIFSAFAFLGLPGWAYSRGTAALYILGYGTIGMIPFYFMGPRAARLGRAHGYVTQAELVAHRFESRGIAGWMALVSVLAFIPYLAIQMKGAGYVLETVSEGAVPQWLGALIVYGIVLTYVLSSGVLGVGWTNTFQGIFMITLAWGLGIYLPGKLHGGLEPMFQTLAETRPELLASPGLAASGDPWSPWEYGSAVLVSAVGFTMWPHLFMKAFSARDIRTLKRTVVLYPTFQIFLLPLLFIGFAGVGMEPAPDRADQILPHILMTADVPPLIVGLFCAGALAASMSSGDAMAHAAASIAVRDGGFAWGKRWAPDAEQRLLRVATVLVMVIAYWAAIAYRGSLVKLLLTTYGAVVQFAPALVLTLFSGRARGSSVLIALIGGTVVTGLFVIAPSLRPFPIHAGAYGLAVQLAFLVPSVLRSPPPSPDVREFLRTAAGTSTTTKPSG
ncbi:MAG: sodium:solute symporter family protein [Myxococcota bacterium]